MNQTPSGDIVSNRSKATLLTTFTSVSIALVQQIKNDSIKTVAVPLAPFLVLLISIFLKTAYKIWKCKKFIKINRGWIIDLKDELSVSNTTSARKAEIKIEIKEYEKEIKRLQKESIEIDFN
jgi:hypothetical protein